MHAQGSRTAAPAAPEPAAYALLTCVDHRRSLFREEVGYPQVPALPAVLHRQPVATRQARVLQRQRGGAMLGD